MFTTKQQPPIAQIYRLGRTNPFKEQEPQYQHSMIVPLPNPSDDTTKLVKAALQGLKAIYRNGYRYKKSGVLLMGLQPKATVQASLFDDTALQTRSTNMMHVMDAINRKMGKDTLSTGASGVKSNWVMRREKTSPAYTTSWNELH